MMEKKEKIECLRYIENGKKIKMVKTDFSGISIDTPEDLIREKNTLRDNEKNFSSLNFF